jgi:parvulin-like peptidyl-prolyl isomerase
MIAGCGSTDSRTVAEVGSEKISLSEFQDFLDRNPLGYRSAEEEFEGKRLLLDSLISHTLLIRAGYEKGLDTLPEVIQAVASRRDRFLLDALYEAHIGDRAAVSEAEIRETYADLEYQVRIFHILVQDPDTANMIFERLKDGESFEQLAYQYSEEPRAKRNRGDMGYFIRGTGPEEFEQVVFNLEVGEITPPFKTSFGWHIVKMVDKKLNEMREEYTRMRPVLRSQIEQYKREQLTQQYFDSIRVAYPIKVDTAVADYLTHKRTVIYPPPVVERVPKYDFDDDMLDRDEKELVLATWEGGQITVMEYLMSVRRWFPPDERPDLDAYDSLASTIYVMKQKDILVHEAMKKNMEQSPVFSETMRLFERYTVAEMMKNDSLFQPEPPTEQELRDFYDLNREEFLMPAQVHVYEILVSDEMLAQQLARDITDLDDFQLKALQYTERAAMRVKRGDLGYIDELHFPELYRAAKRLPVGQVGGPIRSRNKYSVIWPARWTDETYLDFLTVKEDIIDRMTTEARNQALMDWLAERRENTDIEVYDDVIWSTIDRDFYSAHGTPSLP